MVSILRPGDVNANIKKRSSAVCKFYKILNRLSSEIMHG
jgi:hypothetical protein